MGLLDFLKKFKESDIESKYNYLMDKAYNPKIKDDDLSQLNDDEKVFYVLYYFNAELQNGGLCQFFVNSSRKYAPLISEYLEEVGAIKHKKLYDDFIKDNDININDLSFFEINDLSEYQIKANSYPFDSFDDAFYELDELDDLLKVYMEEKNL